MFRKKRIKWAFKCGKSEHRAGRLLGLCILINIALEYFQISYRIYGLIFTFLVWLKYILSHTLEKKLFGKHGPRSGWK